MPIKKSAVKASKTRTKTPSRSTKALSSTLSDQQITNEEFYNSEDFKEKVQQKAYELYLKRGGQEGYEQFDWTMAESIVKLESQIATSLGKKQKSKVDYQTDAIAQKAFEIYQLRGGGEGFEQFDWYLAQKLCGLEK